MTAENASYELLELIGSGGMGHVYRARHHPSGRLVAAKVPHRDLSAELRHLLLREAAAVARLHHPHIVELVDLVEGPVLVMELVEGSNLRAHLATTRSWAPGVSILVQVLDGLAAAHAEGIVHGDLKPANVLLDRDGHVKIADFGLAQLVDPLRRAAVSRKAAGTPAYMAPEQFGHGEELGPWTDLYAVGVILYEMLHGRVPHDGTLSELVAQKVTGQLPAHPPKAGLRSEPALVALVEKLLQTQPRRRPRFAREVRDELVALTAIVDEPTAARDETSWAQAFAPTLVPSQVDDKTSVSGSAMASEPTVQLPHLIAAGDVVGRGLFHLRGTSLVARSAEQAQLHALMDEVARTSSVRALFITGPAGSGKSALARWGLAEAERHATMEGLAAGYDLSGGGMTGGLQHILRRLLDDPFAPSSSEAPSWLGGEAAGFDPDRAHQWLEADRGIASTEDLHLLRDVLLAAARRRPLYLWLDDAGWSRDGAFELVEALLAQADVPILAVLTLRSGTAGHPWVAARIAGLGARVGVEQLELSPLSAVARVELLEQVVPLVADLSAALTGRLRGSSRQLIERAQAWVERGWLRFGPLGWDREEGVSLERLLADGLDDDIVARRLASVAGDSPHAREVLLRAALLGFSFEDGLLMASFPSEEGQPVRAVIGRALLEGVLTFDPIARAHRFENEAIHRHLLDGFGAEGRAQVSARVLARTLEAVFGEGRVGLGGRTAYLHRLAGDRATSYAQLREAVAQLGRLGFAHRAEELAAVGGAWAEADASLTTTEQLDVVLADAFHHHYALRYARALERLEDAKVLLGRTDERERAAITANLEMTIHYYANRFGTASGMAQEAQNLWDGAIEAGLWRSVFVSHWVRSELLGLAGRHDEALAQTLWGLARFPSSPIMSHRIAARLVHCEQLVAAGKLEEAVALADELGVEAENAAALRDEMIDLQVRVHAFVGRWAAPHFEARLAVAERHGDAWRATAHRVYLAWYAVLHEEEQKTRSTVEAMLAAYAATPQEEAMTTLALGHVAAALAHRGDAELAACVQHIVDARHEAIRRGFER